MKRFCLVLVGTLCLTVACKARTDSALKDNAPAAGATTQKLSVQAACANAAVGNAYLRMNGDGSVAYNLSPKKGPTIQPAWTDGRATPAAGPTGEILWTMTLPFTDPALPACVRDGPITTTALEFGLGCSKNDPCPIPDSVCMSGAQCPSGPPNLLLAGGPDTPADPNAPQMALDDATGVVHCALNPVQKWSFYTKDNRLIGVDSTGFADESGCKSMLRQPEHDLLCAWSGSSFAPYNVKTLAVMAIPPTFFGATKSYDCKQTLIDTFANGVICSWTGSGYAPFNSSTGAVIGSLSQSKDRGVCVQKLGVVVAGRMCTWNGASTTVYNIDGTSEESRFGDFDSDADCQSYLNRYKDATAAIGALPADYPPGMAIPLSGDGVGVESYELPWRPSSAPTAGFENYKRCAVPTYNNHLIKMQQTLGTDGKPVVRPRGDTLWELAPECRFDTLYSWGPKVKLDFLKSTIGTGVATWPHQFTRVPSGVPADTSPITPVAPYANVQNANVANVLNGDGGIVQDGNGGIVQDGNGGIVQDGDGGNAQFGGIQGEFNLADAAQPISAPLFTTASPVASFPYGPIPIRFKIREGVRYRLVIDAGMVVAPADYCSYYVTSTEWDNTILVRYWTNNAVAGGVSGLDYILCGPGPIASWSYGTKEHFDEVVKDLRWQATHGNQEYENYVKLGGVGQLMNFDVDSHPSGSAVLLDNLRRLMRDSRVETAVQITINPAGTDRNLGNHFHTKFPVYFLP